jgi:hypothetical protein
MPFNTNKHNNKKTSIITSIITRGWLKRAAPGRELQKEAPPTPRQPTFFI